MAAILTLNAGSSSLKFAIFEVGKKACQPILRLEGQWSGLGTNPEFSASAPDRRPLAGSAPEVVPADPRAALSSILIWLGKAGIEMRDLVATSHRIVHGGSTFSTPCLVDDAAAQAMNQLKELAPLHVPYGLGVLEELRRRLPEIAHFACFDTAFHAKQPDIATRLPLPQQFHDKGYRRYGFHGLNYEHIVEVLPTVTAKAMPSRLLVLHLGNGASIAAIRDGLCIATTMGFTPLDGLIMGTRCGSIDPGVVLALMRDEGFDGPALETLLNKQSGLLALSGYTSDMRTLLSANDEASKRAIAHFCYWAARHAGSLVAALGGLDAIVFTGGIGENAAPVRAKIVEHLAWLGIALDDCRNAANELCLSAESSRISVWRIPANEELTLARHAVRGLNDADRRVKETFSTAD